jgi:hypothetical protein
VTGAGRSNHQFGGSVTSTIAAESALTLLRERLLVPRVEPRDEWEHSLLAAARPWGVSLSDAALSSEGLYD